MPISKDLSTILKNFKTPLTMIRGKKYTFAVDTIEDDGTSHPFYISTSAAGGATFPDVVTENVEHSFERCIGPNLYYEHEQITVAGGWIYQARKQSGTCPSPSVP